VTAIRLESKEEDVRNALKKASRPIQIGDISNKDGSLSFMVSNPADVDAAREAILPLTNGAGFRASATGTSRWWTQHDRADADQGGHRSGDHRCDEHGHRSGAQAYRRAGHA
jgi:hypothetical protein